MTEKYGQYDEESNRAWDELVPGMSDQVLNLSQHANLRTIKSNMDFLPLKTHINTIFNQVMPMPKMKMLLGLEYLCSTNCIVSGRSETPFES